MQPCAVRNPGGHERSSLGIVAHAVRSINGDVHAFVLSPRRRHWPRPLLMALRPTLAVSFRPTRVRLLRGTLFKGAIISKSQQYRALVHAGVPIPRWTALARDQVPDLSGFGRYVVVKPDLGTRGAEVKSCAGPVCVGSR